MNTDDAYLCDLGECLHRPIRPPRPGFIGEEVFAAEWEKLMEGGSSGHDDHSNYLLLEILDHMPGTLMQRHATVAASFICWLGTNCGEGFLHEGRRRESSHGDFGRGYLATWAITNARRVAINSGIRQIECILAPPDHWTNGRVTLLPTLSADDYETIEHLVVWLGCGGESFLHRCEQEIKRRNQLVWCQRRADN